MYSILNSVSYHAVYDTSIREAILYAGENGFAGIQIADESPHISLERLSVKQVDDIKRTAQERSVYIVLHGSDAAASLFQPNRHLITGIRNYYTALLDFASEVSARLVTIHPGEMTNFPTDSQPEYRIPDEDFILYKKVFQENLDFLLDINKNHIPICVENANLEQSTLDLMIPYLERGDIFLCWDIAKSFRKPELGDFFFRHLSWVKQVHLHDQRRNPDGKVRNHCVIGKGDIDFITYLSVLSKSDVQDFCIEVRPREKAKESLEALKQIIKNTG